VSPTVAFTYAATWMLTSLLATGLLHPRQRPGTSDPADHSERQSQPVTTSESSAPRPLPSTE